MKLNVRLVLLGGILVAALAILAWSLRVPTVSASELESLGVVILDEPIHLGKLDLIDENGDLFDGSLLKGKWTYAFFGYTHCPDICPTTLAQLKAVHSNLVEAEDQKTLATLQRMFVSIDAERDNHEAVKSYTDNIDPDLLGVTGTPENVTKFAQSVFVGFEKLGSSEATDDYLVNHQGNIIIFDPEGNCFGFIRSPFEDHLLARAFAGLARFSRA